MTWQVMRFSDALDAGLDPHAWRGTPLRERAALHASRFVSFVRSIERSRGVA